MTVGLNDDAVETATHGTSQNKGLTAILMSWMLAKSILEGTHISGLHWKHTERQGQRERRSSLDLRPSNSSPTVPLTAGFQFPVRASCDCPYGSRSWRSRRRIWKSRQSLSPPPYHRLIKKSVKFNDNFTISLPISPPAPSPLPTPSRIAQDLLNVL